MKALIHPSILKGKATVPCSKSIAHRAMICAGLAEGESIIFGLQLSEDLQATMNCMKTLGTCFSYLPEQNAYLIKGSQNFLQEKSPLILDAHESGSTLRFLIPIAACSSRPVQFLGKASLLSRPMGVYADLFLSQGLSFQQSSKDISFQGPLQPGQFTLPGQVSSQFISGLLLASPLWNSGCAIAVLDPFESKSYTDLTVKEMQNFHVQVQKPSNNGFIVDSSQTYQPARIKVEGDYSQLAFLAVSAAIQGSICIPFMNPNSLQGDKVILDILKQAGAIITWQEDQVCISHHILRPQIIDLADCPDLGPILCVLAAYTPGVTQFIHTERLRYKECDRIQAMEENLKLWGVGFYHTEQGFEIHGKTSWKKEIPVNMDGFNDHRIVMAMAIFTAHAQSEGVIEGAQAIQKSWPTFFDTFMQLHGRVILKDDSQ